MHLVLSVGRTGEDWGTEGQLREDASEDGEKLACGVTGGGSIIQPLPVHLSCKSNLSFLPTLKLSQSHRDSQRGPVR